MKVLEYPFDNNEILKNKRKIKKELLENGTDFVDKRVAILGGSTTSEIKNIMELFLLDCGIRPSFYESSYNRYYEEAVFENPELDCFHPDIIYVHTTNRNISRFPTINDSREKIDELLEEEFNRYVSIWDSLSLKYSCPIIQNNFEMPFFRLLGNKDASDCHGAVNYLTRLNMLLYEYASSHDNFCICDINYISADYGLKEWSNPFYWHMYKYALCVEAIPLLAHNVANIIKSIYGKNKKAMVLDLDNTLWGGVIGDDGVDNIKIGPEDAAGSVYSEFQNYIKAHMDLGILLAVDSKNEYDNAISGLKHPQSILAPDDFMVIEANWEPKDQNFIRIAKKLNLLPESLIFIDDNAAECHIVTEQLRGVHAPDIGSSHEYIQNIDRNGFFETTVISQDDMQRNEMYIANKKRDEYEKSFQTYEQYLSSLEMKATIRGFEKKYYERISQLTNKSNQFNLTTKRYSVSQIEEIAANNEYISLYGRLEDKFGDNGIVAVTIGRTEGEICHIDLWIMSCRVLKRCMEDAMMDQFVKRCKEKGLKVIYGYYYPTEKNHMVSNFYESQGFKELSKDEKGNSKWELKIADDYKPHNKLIKVEAEG